MEGTAAAVNNASDSTHPTGSERGLARVKGRRRKPIRRRPEKGLRSLDAG